MAGISDHELICYSSNLNLFEVKTKFIQYHDYNGIGIESLLQDSFNIAWDESYLYADVNDKIECFLNNINALFEKHVPIKRIKVKSTKPSWFNSNVKRAINNRTRLYQNWKIGNLTKKLEILYTLLLRTPKFLTIMQRLIVICPLASSGVG